MKLDPVIRKTLVAEVNRLRGQILGYDETIKSIQLERSELVEAHDRLVLALKLDQKEAA